jgi:hypothetical protein
VQPGQDRCKVAAHKSGGVKERRQQSLSALDPVGVMGRRVGAGRRRQGVCTGDGLVSNLAPDDGRPPELLDAVGDLQSAARVPEPKAAYSAASPTGQLEYVGLGGGDNDRAGVGQDTEGDQFRGLAATGRAEDKQVLVGPGTDWPVRPPAEVYAGLVLQRERGTLCRRDSPAEDGREVHIANPLSISREC